MSGAINSAPNTPSRPAQRQIYFYFDSEVVRLVGVGKCLVAG